jgi:hypothetical protein
LEKLLIVSILPIVFGVIYFISSKIEPVEADEHWTLIEYSDGLKAFGLFLPGSALLGLTVVLFLFPIKDIADALSFAGLFSFFGLLAIYFYIEFFTVKIQIGPKGVKGNSMWRGRRVYTWSEIENISFSHSSMWFTLTAKEKPPLRIHAMIPGINQVLLHFEEYLPQDKWIKAFKTYTNGKG